MISIPSAVGLAILSKPVYSILKFGNGYNLMMYGSIVLVLMSTVQIQATVLQGLGRLYQVTFNLLLGMVFKIIANYYFIAQPKINILGAIIGSILGFSVPIILNMLTTASMIKMGKGVLLLFFFFAI
jgi:stage V sporulation protein B